jgi:hypothetical protein
LGEQLLQRSRASICRLERDKVTLAALWRVV